MQESDQNTPVFTCASGMLSSRLAPSIHLPPGSPRDEPRISQRTGSRSGRGRTPPCWIKTAQIFTPSGSISGSAGAAATSSLIISTFASTCNPNKRWSADRRSFQHSCRGSVCVWEGGAHQGGRSDAHGCRCSAGRPELNQLRPKLTGSRQSCAPLRREASAPTQRLRPPWRCYRSVAVFILNIFSASA